MSLIETRSNGWSVYEHRNRSFWRCPPGRGSRTPCYPASRRLRPRTGFARTLQATSCGSRRRVSDMEQARRKRGCRFARGSDDRLPELYLPAAPETDNMLVPEQCTFLAVAATREEEQGRGVGRALTAHGLAADHAAGYTHCITDWRVANLLSSRFWPQQGFRPVAYRLSRRLDERIAWSHGEPSPSH